MFANHHALRPRILPAEFPEVANAPRQLPMFDTAGLAVARSADAPATARTSSRLSWARLLARVFSIDVTVCRRCGGKLRVVAAITDEAALTLFS